MCSQNNILPTVYNTVISHHDRSYGKKNPRATCAEDSLSFSPRKNQINVLRKFDGQFQRTRR